MRDYGLILDLRRNDPPPSKGVYSEMGKSEDATRGPIWSDVRDRYARFDQRWGGITVLSVRLSRRGNGGVSLFVLLERTVSVGRGDAVKQQRISRPYPTSDGLNMPGLMFALFDELESRLENDSRLAQRQASF